jgi:hypothetical protein
MLSLITNRHANRHRKARKRHLNRHTRHNLPASGKIARFWRGPIEQCSIEAAPAPDEAIQSSQGFSRSIA